MPPRAANSAVAIAIVSLLLRCMVSAFPPQLTSKPRVEGRARQTSLRPRQDLLQVGKELLPAELGALVGLLLIAPEARLLHAQVRPGARRRERPGDDTFEAHRIPLVRQRLVRLDFDDLTID